MKKITLSSTNGYHIHLYDNMLPEQNAVVFCLHGFAGDKNSSVIAKLTNQLNHNHIGAITFDWPAHGESDAKFFQLTVENCISDLHTVIKYVKKKYNGPLYCFATSFGGYLAMIYHLRYPDLFDRIILRSPALNMGEVFLGLKPPEIKAALERGETLDFGFEQPLMINIDFYHDLKAHDIFHAEVKSPDKIMIIHGNLDEDVPLADSEDFCKRNHIKLHIIEGCDHRYKNPGEVEEVIETALTFYDKIN